MCSGVTPGPRGRALLSVCCTQCLQRAGVLCVVNCRSSTSLGRSVGSSISAGISVAKVSRWEALACERARMASAMAASSAPPGAAHPFGRMRHLSFTATSGCKFSAEPCLCRKGRAASRGPSSWKRAMARVGGGGWSEMLRAIGETGDSTSPRWMCCVVRASVRKPV